MKFSSLAALEVVILTTSGAASDENFVKMTTFSFQCITDNNPALVQIMDWHRTVDKPLSKPMTAWFGDAYMSLSASIG